MLDEASFAAAAAELCATDPDLAAIVERHGLPEFWAREPGLPTLVLLILEQQVSLASARAAYDRLVTRLEGLTTEGILRSTDAELRTDGFSRQKTRYVRALATAIEDGSLDLEAVGSLDDDGVRSALVALPGIGPWTAEVYLLSALAPARHLAGRGHRAPGSRATGATARDAALAGGAGGDRRGVAAAPGERGAPPVAPLPERALNGRSSALSRGPTLRPGDSRGAGSDVGRVDERDDREPREREDDAATERRREERRDDAGARRRWSSRTGGRRAAARRARPAANRPPRASRRRRARRSRGRRREAVPRTRRARRPPAQSRGRSWRRSRRAAQARRAPSRPRAAPGQPREGRSGVRRARAHRREGR